VTLRLLDTFSGIGGFSLAARWLGGFETVQFVERDPYCQRVLAKHWPTVPIHDDICTFNPERGSADVVVGGFPCQDISTAGKQAGIKEGTRSGLFYELIRVVRLVEPRYIERRAWRKLAREMPRMLGGFSADNLYALLEDRELAEEIASRYSQPIGDWRVRCVEIGEVFSSCGAVAAAHHVTQACISLAIRQRRAVTALGLTFEALRISAN
jgi:hypothetical protein